MFRSTGNFDRLLEKATSQLLLEPDWDAILQITDSIRQNDVQPKYGVAAIKKKFLSNNPNVTLFALQVIESCVKNCGASVHHEVACKSFMEDLRNLIKSTTNEKVKSKVLELIQTWAFAFRSESSYRAVQDTLNLMKMEGYTFPAVKYETDAMFTADTAPEWADGECCHRCRVQFSVVQRKHHCRNCGQVFCSKCSNHFSSIPKFGIEKDVRVCTSCFEKLQKSSKAEGDQESSDLPTVYTKSTLSQQPQVPPSAGKTDQELREEEELQLALALSQSEAENKEKEKIRSTHTLLSSNTQSTARSSYDLNNASVISDNPTDNGSETELNKYLNRPYWEQKQQASESQANTPSNAQLAPSAPVSSASPNIAQPVKVTEKFQNGEHHEMEDFETTLKSTIEIFINRMKSKSSRGLPISNDSSIQTLFMNLTAMHSQLLRYLQDQDEQRGYYEKLQDKLSQVKDAREALDALREDHEEKLRQEAEEAERQRQIMMAHKLEIMRKKKQEYLQYQRQIAMQRMQEQEREIMMRQEIQQMYPQQHPPQQAPPPNMMPPNAYATAAVANQVYTPDSGTETSPVHGSYYPASGAPPVNNVVAPGSQPQQFSTGTEYGYNMPPVGNQPGYAPQQPQGSMPPVAMPDIPHSKQQMVPPVQQIPTAAPISSNQLPPEPNQHQPPPQSSAPVENAQPLISFD